MNGISGSARVWEVGGKGGGGSCHLESRDSGMVGNSQKVSSGSAVEFSAIQVVGLLSRQQKL